MTSKPRATKAQTINAQTTRARNQASPAAKAQKAAAKEQLPVPAPALKSVSASSKSSGSKLLAKLPAKGPTKDLAVAVVAPNAQPNPPRPAITPIPVSKQSQLISKLGTAPGLTIDQMMALTGWQAHTVRGTISGVLRKKLGLNVICDSSEHGSVRLYRIAPSVAA